MKQHPELYDKEHGRFHYRQRKDSLWAEISAELKLQPFDVRRWFESQRTRYGKLSEQQSAQAPREMTKRQSWVYQQIGFLKTHIRCKGANRSSGFKARKIFILRFALNEKLLVSVIFPEDKKNLTQNRV